ncbi:MAG: hypothetical protein JWN84_2426 [Nocardioides sp.]|nr:hypothetical protein [Nocardioides sp.]
MTTGTPPGARPGTPRLTVMLCRDCCCGSPGKHPATDHDAQRAAIEDLAAADVRVRTVECLDECDRSNVVLVRDHRLPSRLRDTWLGGVLEPRLTESLCDWVAEGGPLPPALRSRQFRLVRR